MQSFHVLAESGFFKDLSRESLQALAEIASRRELRKRECLFREGQAGHALYLLRQGAVQLHKTAPDGSEVVIKVVQPSEVFAEVVLFEQDRYPVTAVALAASDVLVFPRTDVYRLLERPTFRADFLKSLMRKLRYLTARIVALSTDDVEARLFAFLDEQFGDAGRIELPMSKKDVAAAVGTTPETLSRLIRRLRKQKKLTWTGRVVTRHVHASGRGRS
jgi:CRP/FNR family transcriptional regulator, dissimilatory nitrate respiration regulator